MIKRFKAARRAATPLIAINTPDQPATILELRRALKPDIGMATWDMNTGIGDVLPEGEPELVWPPPESDGLQAEPEELEAPLVSQIVKDGLSKPGIIMGPYGLEPLLTEGILPRTQELAGAVFVAYNAHRLIDDAPVSMALIQARDALKVDAITLVLLSPDIRLPAELSSDVLILEEALPDRAQLNGIVESLADAAACNIDPPETEAAIDALEGLPAFMAEQALAMSIRPESVDLDELWDRKRQMISQTPGLKVYQGDESWDDVAGVANIKTFIEAIVTGRRAPRAIVFIDEIEKALGGAIGGDSSGVSTDQLGMLLKYMEDSGATGIIFVGPAGCSKSMVAKTAGGVAGIPTIEFDLGGMKGSGLVGQAEGAIRAGFKVVDAVSGGDALFLATSNNIGAIPPELRRRFKLGTFFFDVTSDEERKAVWAIQLQRFEISTARRVTFPDDDGWTAADIRKCCEVSYRLDVPLQEAAKYVVPESKSGAGRKRVDELREEAQGRYISASYSGPYKGLDAAPRRATRDLEKARES